MPITFMNPARKRRARKNAWKTASGKTLHGAAERAARKAALKRLQERRKTKKTKIAAKKSKAKKAIKSKSGRPLYGAAARAAWKAKLKKSRKRTAKKTAKARKASPRKKSISGLKVHTQKDGTKYVVCDGQKVVVSGPKKKGKSTMAKKRKRRARKSAAKKVKRIRRKRRKARKTAAPKRRRRRKARKTAAPKKRRIRRKARKSGRRRGKKRGIELKGKFRKIYVQNPRRRRRRRNGRRNPAFVNMFLKNVLPVAASLYLSRFVSGKIAGRVPLLDKVPDQFRSPVLAALVFAGGHFATQKVAALRPYRSAVLLGLGINVVDKVVSAFAPANVSGMFGLGNLYAPVGEYVQIGATPIDDNIALSEYMQVGDYFETAGLQSELGADLYADLGVNQDLGASWDDRNLGGVSQSSLLAPVPQRNMLAPIPARSFVDAVPDATSSYDNMSQLYVGSFSGGFGN